MLSLNCAGGGARIHLQYGYLLAIKELGVSPDFMFGSSVGALTACLYLQGQLDVLGKLCLNLNNDMVYKVAWWNFAGLAHNKNHVLDPSPLKKLIDQYIDYKKLCSQPVTLKIGVTNLTKWTHETFSPTEVTEEEFKTILLASASPPMAFPPVDFRGDKWGDSGVTDNFGSKISIAQGATTIIYLTPTVKEDSKVDNEIDMFNLLTSIPEYNLDRDRAYIDKINELSDPFPDSTARRIKQIIVRPPSPTGIGLLDFNISKENKIKWASYGYHLAKDILNKELLTSNDSSY